MDEQYREEQRRTLLIDQHRLRLFKFVLINNLRSVLSAGLLSHSEVKKRGSEFFEDISNQEVQYRRSKRPIRLSYGKTITLHDCVPLYLTPKTPTSYVHHLKGRQDRLVFIDIDTKVITEWDREILFTTGNASSNDAVLHRDLRDLEKLPWDVLNAELWNEFDDGTRLRNSEFLIHPLILPKFFSRLVVNCKESQIKVRAILTQLNRKLPVDIDQSYFFSSGSNIDHVGEVLPLPF